MNINEISEEVVSSMNKNFHKQIKKDIVLTDNQIEVLNRYEIDVNSVSSMSELIYIIESVLEDEDYPEDLDEIANQISEFNYYNNTNK